ncbi:hypothetical protein JTE90_023226 [Oedothorax gibbosus]|uniref:Secreted protein n=1 Tax=Oedothorax gibbosus TaxID=931172 RepID=A0AAV6VJH2_9ARAC|nr:hypothetical protein JTE90_023226 [Oedothorax gibbosus]
MPSLNPSPVVCSLLCVSHAIIRVWAQPGVENPPRPSLIPKSHKTRVERGQKSRQLALSETKISKCLWAANYIPKTVSCHSFGRQVLSTIVRK